MAKISGIYANGFGEAIAGVCITLTARATSAGVMSGTNATQVTGTKGSYDMEVSPGVYVVSADGNYLGVINVGEDSEDATLNTFLMAYK
ncbi:prophage tail fiber N-terminal domain-containing protein [Enterobacter hormaechei]|nr:prophage tail fiber N-terminal domain-containing protein [Enterobacter hormaechei]